MTRIDNLTINNPKLDRRVKLTEEQRESIRQEYKEGSSKRGLARKYNVDKRLIDFIIDPELYKKSKEQYKERRKDGRYYNKDKHTKAMQKHRKYKRKLKDKGLLK